MWCRWHTLSANTGLRLQPRASEAKRAAINWPVFITDRGRPAHMLIRFEDYQHVKRQRRIAEALAMPGMADIKSDGTLSVMVIIFS
ncbi:MAG: type II toxin-antitoxin system Phd/YefM family antitoxin [Rhodoferax sp.]|uniref:type II toxin-antitoxin system Phd/YefM family antitoxin n=1 Tax=Rhodoferax sp. TaxID=50421 RepID=UPI001B561741|nr:type II toxin-antitoxin system Phd/YefM family antitoxin [Rhodoferax sp.]MBP9904619.1 type II toxin-antitoxin system Phd/YefM family antitoxin [Rhodoferax sp.]